VYVSRASEKLAVDLSYEGNQEIIVVAQKVLKSEPLQPEDLHEIGIVAKIVRVLKLADDRYKVLLLGLYRVRITGVRGGDFFEGEPIPLRAPSLRGKKREASKIIERIRANLQMLVEREHLPEEILLILEESSDIASLSDSLIAHYRLAPNAAQEALEEIDPLKRLLIAEKAISDDLKRFLLSEKILDRTRTEIDKGQREYFLREQLKQIQEELEGSGEASDLSELKKSLSKVSLSKEVESEVNRQLQRLERIPLESSEYALLRNYLEWIAELPWGIKTKEKLDLVAAKKLLDRDHFGLEKAKERILEFLALRKLKAASNGPILCFVGPPGVGKTSLGQSIARATSRKFFRMSLGGVRDEAEIRGHRRTYVGALPGKILQGLRQVGTSNPVFLLDEIDKVGADFRGDPASALLEVLDPQQNQQFSDNYLNLDFDLSDVLFIATANTTDTIPDALLDRLEVIFISTYTLEEKEKIAKRFIIPRQLANAGLQNRGITFTDSAIRFLIERYTAEAGVRNLEREIAALARKIAREVCEKRRVTKRITEAAVSRFLGQTKFDPEMRDNRELVGLARGLAWTINGGEVMPVEVSVAKGNGTLNLTGQLGSIMQESAQAAVFYARSNAVALGLNAGFHQKFDIHVHVPGGATPKDGPSAGITVVCALVSALSGRAVSSAFAMTGEITLRGNVLAVGGLKEKALAALRQSITNVVLPFDNMKDVEDIPKEQRVRLKFHPVKYVSEVFELVLLPKPPTVLKSASKSVKRT
jgi:ATP-dependent Lon protease